MKICHLIYDDVNNPWLGGGGAVRAWEIYRRLAADHEITLVTGKFPGGGDESDLHGDRFIAWRPPAPLGFSRWVSR